MKITRNTNLKISAIPNWLVWLQCLCFTLLYAVWALPETILIRHLCLIIGAIISVYEIWHFRSLIRDKNTTSLWLLAGIFIWATFHLLFLSNNLPDQYEEYVTIWKRTVLGAIFAFGFGLSIIHADIKVQKRCWWVFYFGLITPSLIFAIKYLLVSYGPLWQVSLPDYLLLYSSSAPYYIPKTSYVCFCMPLIAVSVGRICNAGNYQTPFWSKNVIYIFSILLVMFVFFQQNIKNGILYSLILIFYCLLSTLIFGVRINKITKFILVLGVSVSILCLVTMHVERNDSWKALLADARVAVKVDSVDHWKYNGTHGYPQSDSGRSVFQTNYERISWGVVGVKLLVQNPLGYGLIERSFGRLALQAWPDSKLHQTHSGWLDLALGIGLPGILIIFSCLIFNNLLLNRSLKAIPKALNQQNFQVTFWINAYKWIAGSMVLVWLTTELSQKVFFDSLIFWIAFGSGMSFACTAGIQGSKSK